MTTTTTPAPVSCMTAAHGPAAFSVHVPAAADAHWVNVCHGCMSTFGLHDPKVSKVALSTAPPVLASSALTPKCALNDCGAIASAIFTDDGAKFPLCDGCIDDNGFANKPHVVVCHPA